MPTIPDGSVDMILADLPYGTTACKWDTIIPFEPLWKQYKRVIKRNGAIVLFGSQPFTSALVMSNLPMFKYCWVWDKVSKGDIMNAKNKPLKQHEDVCIFSFGTTANGSNRRMTYYPQGVLPNTRTPNRQNRQEGAFKGLRPSHPLIYMRQGTNYPASIITLTNADHTQRYHPTQKPVALGEYLIRTYTNEGETVLDNTMGSGSFGVAAVNTGRDFIGIEKDTEHGYFDIAVRRIREAEQAWRQLELLGA
jgi:site-specific DNA-methyltransferase (adenine-specific)